MSDSTANLNIDPSGVVTGVKKIESSINELFRTFKSFTSSLDTLNNAATKSMGSMYDELTVKAAKGENGLQQVRLDALTKMKADTRARLNVASGENAEIQRLYESRLATASTLSNQELNVWKRFGASLGGIQKAQLQGTELAYLQSRLERSQEITDLASHLANVEAASVKLRAAYDKAVSGKRKSSELKAQLKENEVEVEASRIRLAALNDAFDKTDLEAIARHARQRAEVEDFMYKEALSELQLHAKQLAEVEDFMYKESLSEATRHAKQLAEVEDFMYKESLSEATRHAAQLREVEDFMYKESVSEATRHAAQLREVEDFMYKESVSEATRHAAQLAEVEDFMYKEALSEATRHAKQLAEVEDFMYKESLSELLKHAAQRREVEDFMYKESITKAKIAAEAIEAANKEAAMDVIAVWKMEEAEFKRQQIEKAAAAKAAAAAIAKANLSAAASASSVNAVDFKTANAGLRGLTQGFGMLSIGISSMLPFLASFAAGAAFMNTIRVGKEFENSMFEIQELAGTSAAQMDNLRASISKLADTTQYRPTDLAEGLSILSLAGLKANEAMNALVPTLNFAAAGGVKLEAAAMTLVSVGTAYGYSSDKFTTVADVIAKTAADTMSSVTNMSEAFKTSSVVAQQYGVSLDDTARSLGMLAQIGITGSAAGTSYRNMITEFNKGTGRAAEAIKALGIQVIDTNTGAAKPLIETMRQLTAGLVTYSAAAQQRILQDMTTERGAKSTAAYQAAALAQINKTLPTLQREIDYLRESGKSAEAKAHAIEAVNKAYEAMTKKLADSQVGEAGMTFFANLEKQFKPAEQLSGIAASLQEAFLQTFKALEAPLFNLGQQIRDLFKSDDFRAGLTSLASLMVQFVKATVTATAFVIEHSKAIIGVAAAYAGWKLALIGIDVAVMVGTKAFALAAAATTAYGVAMTMATGAANALTLAAAISGSTLAVSAGAVLALTAGVVALGVAVVALTGYWLLADTEAEKALNTQRDAANARRKIADEEVKSIQTQLSIQAEQLDASNRSNLQILYTRQNNAKLTEMINDKTFQAFKARKEGELDLEKRLMDQVATLRRGIVTEAQLEEKTRVDAANARIDMWVKEKEMILEAIRLNQIWGLTGILGGGKSIEQAEAIANERYNNSIDRIKGEAAAMKTGMADRIKLAIETQTKLAAMDKASAQTPKVVGEDSYGSKNPGEQIKAQMEARALKAKEDALLKVTDAIEKFNVGSGNMEESLKKVTAAETFEITTIQLLDKAVAMGAISWQKANLLIKEIEATKARRDDAEEVNGIQKIIDATVLLNTQLQDTVELNVKGTAAEALKAQLTVASSKLTKEESKILADKAKSLIAVAVSLEAAKHDQEAYNKAVQESIKVGKEIRTLIETINVQSKAEKELEANRAEAMRQGPEYLAKLEAEIAVTEKYAGQIAKFSETLDLQEAAYRKVRDASDSWELVDSTEVDKARAELNELIALIDKLRGQAGLNAMTKALTVQRDVLASSLADAVMVGLEQGTEAGVASMRKIIEDEFLRKPIQVFIKATISEILGGKDGDTSLGGVISGIADGSSLTKLANLGSNLAGNGSINAAVGNFAGSSVGTTLGLNTSSMAADGFGPANLTSAGNVASNLPYLAMLSAYKVGGVEGFATGAAGIAVGGAISGGVSALAAGTSALTGAATGLTAALAAVPVYGWIALGAAALLGMGNKKFETTYGGDFTADQSGLRQTRGNGTGGNFANQVMEKSILGTTVNINSVLASLGSKANVTSLSGGANSNMEKAESYSFVGGSLSNGKTFGTPTRLSDNLGKMSPEDVLKAFATDLKRATLQAIQAVEDVPVTVSDMMKGYDLATMKAEDLDVVYEAVNKVITDTQSLQTVLKTLPFKNLTDLSFDAAAGLIKFSGGLDALATNLNGYYENYYTAEENRAQSIKNITGTLNAAGIAVTEAQVGAATREDFRALFETFKDLSGTDAQMAVSALLSVQGAFAEINPIAEKASTSIAKTGKSLQDLAEDARLATEQAAAAITGFDAAGLGKMMLEAAFNPQAGMTAAQSFAVALETSIRQTLINSVVNDIATTIFNSIVIPMVAGAALADGAVETIVKDAKKKLETLGAVFASQDFKDGLALISGLVAELMPPIQALGYQSTVAVVAVDSLTISVEDLAKAAETKLKDARTGVQGLRDEATDRYLAAQQKVITAQQALANAIHSTVKTFKDFLSTLDGAQKPTVRLSGARQAFDELSTKARAGDTEALSQLPSSAKAFLDLSKGYSASIVDYRRDEAKVRGVMEEAITAGTKYLEGLPAGMQVAKDPIAQASDDLSKALLEEADARVLALAMLASLTSTEKTLGDRYLALIKELSPEEELALRTVYTSVTDAYTNLKNLGVDPLLASVILEKAMSDSLTASGSKLGGVYDSLSELLAELDIETYFKSLQIALKTSQTAVMLAVGMATTLLAEAAASAKSAAAAAAAAAAASFVGPTQGPQAPYTGPTIPPTGGSGLVTEPTSVVTTPSTVVTPPPVFNNGTQVSGTITPGNSVQAGYDSYQSTLAYTGAAASGNSVDIFNSGTLRYYTSNGVAYSSVTEVAKLYAETVKTQGAEAAAAAAASYGLTGAGLDIIKSKAPKLATGTNYLPRDMLIQAHEGEAVIPKAFNPAQFGTDSGMKEVVAELKAVKEELKTLKENSSRENNAIIAQSVKSAKLLEKFDDVGIPTTVA